MVCHIHHLTTKLIQYMQMVRTLLCVDLCQLSSYTTALALLWCSSHVC